MEKLSIAIKLSSITNFILTTAVLPLANGIAAGSWKSVTLI